MSRTPSRRSTRLQSALAKIGDDREELVKNWILRTLAVRPLSRLQGVRVDRLVREGPGLVDVVLRHLAIDGDDPPGAEWVARLCGPAEGGGASAAELASDIAALEAAILTALHHELGDESLILAHAIASVTATFAGIHAVGGVAATGVGRSHAVGDPVTGLPSHEAFRRRLDHLVRVHERYRRPFALLLLEVTGLDRVTHAHGAAAADQVLAAVAEAVTSGTRAVDTAARLEHNQLGVLLPEQAPARLAAAAERIGEAVRRADVPERLRAEISIGVVGCPEHATAAGPLLEAAQEALHRAQAANRVVAIGPAGPDTAF